MKFSASPAKMVSGNARPTPSTEGMNAPIVASPQKSDPSQKRQIGARLYASVQAGPSICRDIAMPD